jgi:hypothetical protein
MRHSTQHHFSGASTTPKTRTYKKVTTDVDATLWTQAKLLATRRRIELRSVLDLALRRYLAEDRRRQQKGQPQEEVSE